MWVSNSYISRWWLRREKSLLAYNITYYGPSNKKIIWWCELTIGPAIENGFYYDFDTEKHFSEEDFEKIEEEMKKIIKEDLSNREIFTIKRRSYKIYERKWWAL